MVSDNVTLASMPNSIFYGDYNIKFSYHNVTAGDSTIYLALGLPEYPQITPADNVISVPVEMTGIETPRPDFYPVTEFPTNAVNGSVVLLQARIFNVGNMNATDVLVRFYDGSISPGTQIGTDFYIAKLNMGDNTTASTSWIANGTQHEIFVVVDPLNTIPEKNEGNNTASAIISIIQQADLAIGFSDVSFAPPSPIVNGSSTIITARVHNLGDINITGAKVGFYIYEATGKLTQIANNTVDVLARDWTETVCNWKPPVARSYTARSETPSPL
jgi:subtilase family serine protease